MSGRRAAAEKGRICQKVEGWLGVISFYDRAFGERWIFELARKHEATKEGMCAAQCAENSSIFQEEESNIGGIDKRPFYPRVFVQANPNRTWQNDIEAKANLFHPPLWSRFAPCRTGDFATVARRLC
jgi:hypothetical protein